MNKKSHLKFPSITSGYTKGHKKPLKLVTQGTLVVFIQEPNFTHKVATVTPSVGRVIYYKCGLLSVIRETPSFGKKQTMAI